MCHGSDTIIEDNPVSFDTYHSDTPRFTQTFLSILTCLMLFVSGCAVPTRNPVPLDQLYEAEVVGMEGVRAWEGEISPLFQEDIIASIKQESEGLFENPETGRKNYNALAISGGGADGAFGAGFLYGWTKSGNRPLFKVVSGISTGALTAPFAFLGPEYDERLKEIYTSVNTGDIVTRKSIFKILRTRESVAESTPLKNLVHLYIDQDLLDATAEAHDQGRRLYIGTTNMDAQKLVVWNMGLIAKSGSPLALSLFKEIMLASSSIPGAMPPVYIEVEAGGSEYDEMHTDGGLVTQVFVHAKTFNMVEAGKAAGLNLTGNLFNNMYIIVNGQFTPAPEQISRRLTTISSRSLKTMTKSAVYNNLYRMYVLAQREKTEFFYTCIPESYVSQGVEIFDSDEMTRLFKMGQKLGESENPWFYVPPGYSGPLK